LALFHTPPGSFAHAAPIATRNIAPLLDCWPWYTTHATREDLARLRADQVVYVHVNDAPPGRDVDEQIDDQRLLPGASGVIDIAGFLQTLDRMGYDGPVAAEPFNAELNALPPAERVRLTGQAMARIWAQAGRAR